MINNDLLTINGYSLTINWYKLAINDYWQLLTIIGDYQRLYSINSCRLTVAKQV